MTPNEDAFTKGGPTQGWRGNVGELRPYSINDCNKPVIIEKFIRKRKKRVKSILKRMRWPNKMNIK